MVSSDDSVCASAGRGGDRGRAPSPSPLPSARHVGAAEPSALRSGLGTPGRAGGGAGGGAAAAPPSAQPIGGRGGGDSRGHPSGADSAAAGAWAEVEGKESPARRPPQAPRSHRADWAGARSVAHGRSGTAGHCRLAAPGRGALAPGLILEGPERSHMALSPKLGVVKVRTQVPHTPVFPPATPQNTKGHTHESYS